MTSPNGIDGRCAVAFFLVIAGSVIPARPGAQSAGSPTASAAAGASTEVVLEPVFGLTGFLRSAQVLHERAGFPFRADVLHPSYPGDLPAAALVMPPPCKVLLTRPETEFETTLRLAVGVDASEFDDRRAAVRFIAELDGERILDEVRHPRSRAGAAQRAWVPIDVSVKGRSLVLMTQVVGQGDAPTKVGFVRLEELERREVTRRAPEPAYPNVLFVCVGGLRPDRLACHGHARATSPALDALAARGTRFERAYASSSSTLLSTASLMTGLPPPEHGLDAPDRFLGREHSTLAEAFRSAGVRTAAFSASSLIKAARGFGQGFEAFEDAPGVPARSLVPDVLRWLDEQAGQRFFVYLHLTDLVSGSEPEPEFVQRFGVPALPDLPAEILDRLPERRLAGLASLQEQRYLDALATRYDAQVATVDRWLGQLFDGLVARGLDGTTIVCVTSDHGLEFLEHDLVGAGLQLYDESVRVPLLFAGPGVPAGQVLTERVENRFVVETLRRLARVGTVGARGADLLQPYARLQHARNPLFFVVGDGRWVDEGGVSIVSELYAVDVDGFRLLWSPAGEGGVGGRTRLHDLGSDPAMRHDVAHRSPQRSYAFQRMIASWLDLGREVRPAGLGGQADGAAVPRADPESAAGSEGHEARQQGE